MKKLILFVISFLFIMGYSVSASETVTYNIDEFHISVDIPKEYLVFTKNIKDDNPSLKKTGLTKEAVVSFLESGNMYLCALPENREFEIYLCFENKSFSSLNKLSPEEKNLLINSITYNITQANMQPSNFLFYDNNGQTFIKYEIRKDEKDYLLQCGTIYGKKRLVFY